MHIKEEIWIEKYRPERLDDIVGQDEIIRRLKSYVKTRNLPHLLFSGPPGVGKTAASISIVKEIFGEGWRNNFIELNASDERGIDIIRHKVKDFARMAPLGKADFKVIFLDEADALTNDAQSALRRTMERYSATTRFILSCNYSSKIIEPIQSRCAVYRFKPLSADAVRKRIGFIASEEKLKVSEGGLSAIEYVAGGDMRRAINALQAAALLGDEVDEETIYQITSTARPEEIRSFIKTAISGDFVGARAMAASKRASSPSWRAFCLRWASAMWASAPAKYWRRLSARWPMCALRPSLRSPACPTSAAWWRIRRRTFLPTLPKPR